MWCVADEEVSKVSKYGADRAVFKCGSRVHRLRLRFVWFVPLRLGVVMLVKLFGFRIVVSVF